MGRTKPTGGTDSAECESDDSSTECMVVEGGTGLPSSVAGVVGAGSLDFTPIVGGDRLLNSAWGGAGLLDSIPVVGGACLLNSAPIIGEAGLLYSAPIAGEVCLLNFAVVVGGAGLVLSTSELFHQLCKEPELLVVTMTTAVAGGSMAEKRSVAAVVAVTVTPTPEVGVVLASVEMVTTALGKP